MTRYTDVLKDDQVSSPYVLDFLSPSINKQTGDSETLALPRIELGRSNQCAIQYPEQYQTVSRRHAAIEKRGSACFLVNLSTTNPTLVNGQAVNSEQELQSFDEIQLSVDGPLLRFRVTPIATPPKGKIGLTEKIVMVSKQAVRPYKMIVYSLGTALLLLIPIAIILIAQQENRMDRSKEELARVEQRRQEDQQIAEQKLDEMTQKFTQMKSGEEVFANELRRANSVISQQNNKIARMEKSITDQPMSTVEMYQEFKKNIYFLELVRLSVTTPEGTHISINASWTGSAFLCDDGKLVTARHCIQGWRYAYDSTSVMLNLIESSGGRINAKYRVTSSLNDVMEFDYSDVVLDDSKDQVKIANGYRFKVPTDDASDWAYVRTRKASNITYDKSASGKLRAGEKLYVLGFSLAIGGPRDGEIKPLYSTSDVAQDGLSPEGLIMLTNRNFEQGNSGGPVFILRENTYRCVGIISIARMDVRGGFSTIGGVVPISSIR